MWILECPCHEVQCSFSIFDQVGWQSRFAYFHMQMMALTPSSDPVRYLWGRLFCKFALSKSRVEIIHYASERPFMRPEMMFARLKPNHVILFISKDAMRAPDGQSGQVVVLIQNHLVYIHHFFSSSATIFFLLSSTSSTTPSSNASSALMK